MSSDKVLGSLISFHKYQIKLSKVIAQGGFGVVYCGVDVNTKEKYAVKRLIVTPSRREVIEREAFFSRQFGDSPNIVKMYEACETKIGGINQVFLINELCSGGTILQYLNSNGRFSEQEIAYIYIRLLRAVSVLHNFDPPVIHRDLKIENILVTKNGEIRLCDFGSATSQFHDLSDYSVQQINCLEDEIAGFTTPLYRSPEMADLFQRGVLGLGQDTWALGCVLYCFCFGQLPFVSPLAITRISYTLPDHLFSPLIGRIFVFLPRPSVSEITAGFLEITKQFDLNRTPGFLIEQRKGRSNFISKAMDQLEQLGDSIRTNIKDYSSKFVSSSNAETCKIEMKPVTSRIIVFTSNDVDKSTMSECEKMIDVLKTKNQVIFVNFPPTSTQLTNAADITWFRRSGDTLHNTLTTLSNVHKRMISSPNVMCVLYGRQQSSPLHFFACALVTYCRLFDNADDVNEFISHKKGPVVLSDLEHELLNYIARIVCDAEKFSSHYDWHIFEVALTHLPKPACKLYMKILVDNKRAFPSNQSLCPIPSSNKVEVDIDVRGVIKLEVYYLSKEQNILPLFHLLLNSEKLKRNVTFHRFSRNHIKFADSTVLRFDNFEVVVKMTPNDCGLSFIDNRWRDISTYSLFPSAVTASNSEISLISDNFNISEFSKNLISKESPETANSKLKRKPAVKTVPESEKPKTEAQENLFSFGGESNISDAKDDLSESKKTSGDLFSFHSDNERTNISPGDKKDDFLLDFEDKPQPSPLLIDPLISSPEEDLFNIQGNKKQDPFNVQQNEDQDPVNFQKDQNKDPFNIQNNQNQDLFDIHENRNEDLFNINRKQSDDLLDFQQDQVKDPFNFPQPPNQGPFDSPNKKDTFIDPLEGLSFFKEPQKSPPKVSPEKPSHVPFESQNTQEKENKEKSSYPSNAPTMEETMFTAKSRRCGAFDDVLGDFKMGSSVPPPASSAPKSMRELKESSAEQISATRKRVAQWAHGKGKNIRLLLSTLGDALWEDAPWTPVTMGHLITANDVKKVYRRAVLMVHPDKIKSAKAEEFACLIYSELSEAWALFTSTGMKDL